MKKAGVDLFGWFVILILPLIVIMLVLFFFNPFFKQTTCQESQESKLRDLEDLAKFTRGELAGGLDVEEACIKYIKFVPCDQQGCIGGKLKIKYTIQKENEPEKELETKVNWKFPNNLLMASKTPYQLKITKNTIEVIS